MIHRSMDVGFFNRLANDPTVRPFLGGGDGRLDLRDLVTNPNNICLTTDHGGWVLQMLLPSVYELHTLFLPEGRGRFFRKASVEALRYVFTRTDALEIVTKCPVDNPGARMAALLAGFHERFFRDQGWEGRPCSFQVLSIDDWLSRDPAIQAEGHTFHTALKVAKAGGEQHPEDEAHDRVVGAVVLMIKAGLSAKGVGIYNRWAVFAGYQQINMLTPTVFDIHDALIEAMNGEMRVLDVR